MDITEIDRFLVDEAAAQHALCELRWPNGIVCPNRDCRGDGKIYEVAYSRRSAAGEAIATVRRQWKCGSCRKRFSVTTGSIFEGSHIPVGKWIWAVFLMCSSPRGVTATDLARQLAVTYKSAWFICYRVRRAIRQEPLAPLLGRTSTGEHGKSLGVPVPARISLAPLRVRPALSALLAIGDPRTTRPMNSKPSTRRRGARRPPR